MDMYLFDGQQIRYRQTFFSLLSFENRMIFTASDFDNHEKVLFCRDTRTNLKAIIAIHSSRLGAAAGGCRMYPYTFEREALDDVLRLSRAMTYKNALAGLKLGGGKSVIIGAPAELGAPDRLAAFGRCVEALGGAYWTARRRGRERRCLGTRRADNQTRIRHKKQERGYWRSVSFHCPWRLCRSSRRSPASPRKGRHPRIANSCTGRRRRWLGTMQSPA